MVQIPLARLGAALLAAGVAVSVSAQTTGSMIGVVTDHATGKPLVGVQVVATSPQLQGERVAITERDGTWRLDQLPPGTYALQGELLGYVTASRGGARLGVDMTLRVNLSLVPEVVTLDETVVKTGQAPAVDVGSAETGLVVEEVFIETVPVRSTSFADVAIAAPTALNDVAGIGFSGGQSPENRYAIEGLDVTDPWLSVNYVPLVTDFVEQVDVKTGNYAAEYGRATGGLVSAVTKSGSNAFSGSVFFRWLGKPPEEPVGTNGLALWTQTNAPGSYQLETGAELGGPIVKDRLWFHVGIAPQLDRTVRARYARANVMAEAGACPEGASPDSVGRCRDAYGTYLQDEVGERETVLSEKRTLQYHGKLTWTPAASHTFTLAAFGTPNQAPEWAAVLNGYEDLRTLEGSDGIFDVVGRWNGRFLESRLITEVVAGYHLDLYSSSPAQFVNGHDLYTYDTIRWRDTHPLDTFEAAPAECEADPWACPVQFYRTNGWGWRGTTDTSRLMARASAGLVFEALGSHVAKVGADLERTWIQDDGTYPAFWDHYGGDAVFYRFGFRGPLVQSAASTSPALFVQDSWQPVRSLTLNLGVRWEAQYMDRLENRDEISKIELDGLVAPRVQAIWDPSGTGRTKIGASWGRFYENIPLNVGMNLGSFSQQEVVLDETTCAGYTGPTSQTLDLSTCGVLFEQDYLSAQPVAPDLRGQYVDQFALTAEWEILTDVSVGVTFEGRRLGPVIEDLSSDDGATYFIANPGQSAPFEVDGVVYDAQSPAVMDPFSRRTVEATYPKPERRYEGVTFRLAKSFSRGWLAEASYTWSRLSGNFSGPIRPESGQLNPNLTSEYDLATLMGNRTGYLPGDRPHTLKLYGAYRWQLAPRLALSLGAGFTALSGQPMNVLGRHNIYGPSEAYLVQRGDGGRTPWMHQLDTRVGVDWTLARPWVLQVSLDAFNVYGAETETRLDELWTDSFTQPIMHMRCSGGNPAAEPDPVSATLASCEPLAYLKDITGRPAIVRPNYGRGRTYQAPRAFRVSVAMSF